MASISGFDPEDSGSNPGPSSNEEIGKVKPRKGEKRDAFMQRCISTLIRDENKPQNQAIAICSSEWSRRNKKKKPYEEDKK